LHHIRTKTQHFSFAVDTSDVWLQDLIILFYILHETWASCEMTSGTKHSM